MYIYIYIFKVSIKQELLLDQSCSLSFGKDLFPSNQKVPKLNIGCYYSNKSHLY